MLDGSVAQIAGWSGFPFPPTGLSCELCDRDAECGEAVQDGDTDLELRNLTVEVPRHEALVQQLHTMHLCLCAAPAVVTASSPLDVEPQQVVHRLTKATGWWL